MENGNKKAHPEGCQCGMCQGGMAGGRMGCGCGYGWGHGGSFAGGLLRVVVAIFLLGIVFWFGLLIGELRIIVGGGHGYMMRGYYGGMQPMMQKMPGAVMPTSTTY